MGGYASHLMSTNSVTGLHLQASYLRELLQQLPMAKQVHNDASTATRHSSIRRQRITRVNNLHSSDCSRSRANGQQGHRVANQH